MTEDEAQEKLALMVLAEEEPVLSAEQLEALVELARRPDEQGFVFTDGTAVWTPSWDLNFAAAEGWRRKAGIAASRFSFSEDGQRFERAQVYAHCVAQAEAYARKGMGSIPVLAGTAT